MTTNQIRLQIAEKSTGSRNFLALLRWALVIIFLWFGGMKFTAYEAAGIAREHWSRDRGDRCSRFGRRAACAGRAGQQRPHDRADEEPAGRRGDAGDAAGIQKPGSIYGSARSILTAERTALNFLGRMSGIATLSRRYIEAVRPGSSSLVLELDVKGTVAPSIADLLGHRSLDAIEACIASW